MSPLDPNKIQMNATIEIPLKASFGGWKIIPWIAWSHNNISQRLTLHSDRVEFRLFRLRSRPYSSISCVDYRGAIGTENIVLEFKDYWTTFIGNAVSRAHAKNTIHILHGKGCLLSDRAMALLQSDSSGTP